jgi:hypothetical protein
LEIFTVLKGIDGIPSCFQFLPFGRIEIERGAWAVLDEESMSLIEQDFARRGNDMVIDYEHQTLNGEKAPAAGWIKKFINKGREGLWAVVEWTERAKQYLLNREYRYYSPVVMIRREDQKIVQVINAALTNAPRINRLKPLVAKRDVVVFIDETQRRINKMMGITDEAYMRFAKIEQEEIPRESPEELQKRINKMMGISDEVFLKYRCKSPDPDSEKGDLEKIKRLIRVK